MHPFPKGFRMLSGLAVYRDEGAEASQGVRISLNRDQPANGNTKTWPKESPATPPLQTILSIFFPRCGWANQTLDTPNHFDHMTWPIANGDNSWSLQGTKCPDTHPILYPSIILEMIYELDEDMKAQWRTNEPNFILANGDVTGATFHGDFVNGWDIDVLAAAIDQCSNAGDDLQNCAPFAGHLQDQERWDCRIEGAIPDEDIGFYRPLDKLPGCNPIWGWDGPSAKPECKDPNPPPAWVAPRVQYKGIDNYSGIPLTLPGVDVSNLATLVPSSGWVDMYDKPFTPAFFPWAMDQSGKTPVQNVLRTAPGPDILANGFSATAPDVPAPADLAAMAKPANVHFMKQYNCPTNNVLPCGTYPGARNMGAEFAAPASGTAANGTAANGTAPGAAPGTGAPAAPSGAPGDPAASSPVPGASAAPGGPSAPGSPAPSGAPGAPPGTTPGGDPANPANLSPSANPNPDPKATPSPNPSQNSVDPNNPGAAPSSQPNGQNDPNDPNAQNGQNGQQPAGTPSPDGQAPPPNGVPPPIYSSPGAGLASTPGGAAPMATTPPGQSPTDQLPPGHMRRRRSRSRSRGSRN